MNKKYIKRYTQFRENYDFVQEPVEEKDGFKFFRGVLVEDDQKKYSEGEDFLNIGYGFKNSTARVLSNLYPMRFKFRGKWVASIEGVLQGIKYKDKKHQNLVLKYYGFDAYHTRASNEANFWGNDGKLYWQGKVINRHDQEYQQFLDELYLFAAKNPIYKNTLLATENKYLLHHFGQTDPNITVLTRFEYEQRLNSLRAYLREKLSQK